MKKEIKEWLKQVRAAQRNAEKLEGTLMRYKSQTIPNKKRVASREACRGNRWE